MMNDTILVPGLRLDLVSVFLRAVRTVSQSGQGQLQDEPLQEQSTESRGDEAQEGRGGHPTQETKTRTAGVSPSSDLIVFVSWFKPFFSRMIL